MYIVAGIIFLIIFVFAGNHYLSELPTKEDAKTNKNWWTNKRNELNFGLCISSFISFFTFIPFSNILTVSMPAGILLIFYQLFIYFLIILLANILFSTGNYLDRKFIENKNIKKRTRLLKIGFWFLIGLPFIKPIILIAKRLL